jgi:hypothetical protein
VLIAIGVDWEGRRQVLAVDLFNRESGRGLKGVELIESDDHPGSKKAGCRRCTQLSFAWRVAFRRDFATSGARVLSATATKRRTDSERFGRSSCWRRQSSMALTAASSKPISSLIGNLSGFGMKYSDMFY